MTSGETVLVTGGAGFIGSNYVRFLLQEKGCCVVNLDALTYAGHLETLEGIGDWSEHHFVLGSVGDRSLVDYLMKRYQPVAVVHFAAETHVDRSIDSPDVFMRANVMGTSKLLESTRIYWNCLSTEKQRAFRFVHISSDKVYGSLTHDDDRSDENSAYRPCSPYAASKAASNHLIQSYVQTYGLPLLTVNGSKIFGAYQYPEALIPRVIRNAVLGQVLSVSRSGENVRDWLFVEDFCRAIDRVLEAGRSGEVYNVGGGNEMKNEDVVNSLCGSLVEASEDFPFSRQSCLAEFSDNPPGRNLRYAMDCTKIGEELGWAPQESFATGLAKTVAWYLEHQNWCRKVMESR